MKLGYLKKSLTRYPSDMDDCEVLIIFHDGKQIDYDCLAFIFYASIDASTTVILGTVAAGKEQLKNGKLQLPDGSEPPPDSFDIKD